MKNKFALKEIRKMKNNILDTDILGLDLLYNREESVITLSINRYITTLAEDYKDILKKMMTRLKYHTCQDITLIQEKMN